MSSGIITGGHLFIDGVGDNAGNISGKIGYIWRKD